MPSEDFSGIASVAIIHNGAIDAADKAAADVFDQLVAVEKVFAGAAVPTLRVAADLNLEELKNRLATEAPSLVFNLVEAIDGSDRLQSLIPLALEDWRVPFSGSGSLAMLLANHKIESKRRFVEQGLPTPGCAWLDTKGRLRLLPDAAVDGDWIVKALEAHASVFLDDSSVVRSPGRGELAERIRAATSRHGMPFFAERFIEGREFNLTVLENPEGEPECMPAAEILFNRLPARRPRIVGYAAKWDEDSLEYLATPRSFDSVAGDAVLTAELSELAVAVWRTLGLAGYARVDFRVDAGGRPYILEANANPCLTPTAGLAAAAERGGLGYAALIARVARAGMRRGE